MVSFGEMWYEIGGFLIIWCLYTIIIYRKAAKTGTHFMNLKNGLFVGYVGLTLALIVLAIFSLFLL